MVPKGHKRTALPVDEEDTPLEGIHNLEKQCATARAQKKNFPFAALKKLALAAGFEIKNQEGSHLALKHPTHGFHTPNYDLISIQSVNNCAKAYQIEQVIDFIQTAPRKTGSL